MAMEGEEKGKDQESSSFLPTFTEDEVDGPRKYSHVGSPWYSDLSTIVMLVYLGMTLLGGSIILIWFAFTQDPWMIFGIVIGFVAVTLLAILVKIRLGKMI